MYSITSIELFVAIRVLMVNLFNEDPPMIASGIIALRPGESQSVAYGNLTNPQKLMQSRRIYRIHNKGPGDVTIRVDNDNTSDVVITPGRSCDAEGLRVVVFSGAGSTDPVTVTYDYVT